MEKPPRLSREASGILREAAGFRGKDLGFRGEHRGFCRRQSGFRGSDPGFSGFDLGGGRPRATVPDTFRPTRSRARLARIGCARGVGKSWLIFFRAFCYDRGVSVLAEPTFAWEPLTPRGVAAFARASFERLFIVQTLVASLAAAVVVWVLSDGIFPTISEAIQQLPEQGKISHGKLEWTEDSAYLLAEGKILSLAVDLDHAGAVRSPADFQFEFGRDSLCVISLLGQAEVAYPPEYDFVANHRDLRPLWGAWEPNLLGLAAIGTFLGLLLTWLVLATVYCVPVWVFCFFGHRAVNLRASWKLAAAALLPGALLLSLALVLYETRAFDLVQLGFAFGMHLIIGWIYLFVAPLFLNRVTKSASKNPFLAAEK